MTIFLLSAAPAASTLHSAAAYELGVGRAVPTAAALLGLTSVIVGWVALRHARRHSAARTAIVLALTLGPISVITGGLHGANSAGGLGTGNGLAGAIFAVVLGAGGTVIGGLALARTRRAVGTPG